MEFKGAAKGVQGMAKVGYMGVIVQVVLIRYQNQVWYHELASCTLCAPVDSSKPLTSHQTPPTLNPQTTSPGWSITTIRLSFFDSQPNPPNATIMTSTQGPNPSRPSQVVEQQPLAVRGPPTGLRTPSNRKTIYDRNLNRTRTAELSRASFAYLFAEMVTYAQKRVTGIQDLEKR